MSTTFFERLRTERERLGKTQEEFAVIAGVTRRPYIEWEKGSGPAPDALQLAALAAAGLDVLFVVTGRRSQAVAEVDLLPEGDRTLLANFHAAPAQVQAGVKTTLGAFAGAPGHVAKSRRRAA